MGTVNRRTKFGKILWLVKRRSSWHSIPSAWSDVYGSNAYEELLDLAASAISDGLYSPHSKRTQIALTMFHYIDELRKSEGGNR